MDLSNLDEALEWIRDSGIPGGVLVGGCVRDTLLGRVPQDWDVFCLGSSELQLRRILGPAMRPEKKHFLRHHALCGECIAPFGKVQILSTGYLHVDDLLSTSDWNVSAFAYDGVLTSLMKIGDVSPGGPLRLISVSNPICTLHRGFKFSDRYEMVFEYQDIRELCRLATGDRQAVGRMSPPGVLS